jgi:hypothetical protein
MFEMPKVIYYYVDAVSLFLADMVGVSQSYVLGFFSGVGFAIACVLMYSTIRRAKR